MPQCGNCGAETSRTTTLFEVKGQPLATPRETCPKCDGSTDAIHSQTDRRLWLGHEVYDAHYKKTVTPDGQIVYQASDALVSDLVEEWSKNPDQSLQEAAEEELRRWAANHRKPLTPSEIERATQQIREQIARERALDAGLALPI